MNPHEHTAPEWTTRLFYRFCKSELFEDIQGDLFEEYQLKCNNQSIIRAKMWYNWQILCLFNPTFITSWAPFSNLKSQCSMISNYLKIGLRSLWKFKTSSLINISGLSLGMSAFLLIGLFVWDEWKYERHHEHAQEVFRITVQNFNTDGEMSRHWAFASAGHAHRIKAEFPQVTHATKFFPWLFPDIIVGDEKLSRQQVAFADEDVFEIFTFNFLLGNPQTAFANFQSLILTEETAVKLYGNDWETKNLLDQTVKLNARGSEVSVRITGVIENMPKHQHFHFRYLAPFKIVEPFMDEGELEDISGNYNYLSYVRAAPGTSKEVLNGQSDAFYDKYVPAFQSIPASSFYKLKFQPLLDIHLTSNLSGEIETNGSLSQVYIFSVIGLLMLVIACINYVNLATARYSRRIKEIGVRKSIGAGKGSLTVQFLTESILTAIISLPVTVLLVVLALPQLNHFIDKNLEIDFLDPTILLLFAGTILLVGFVSGLYPSLILSRTPIVSSLKGMTNTVRSKLDFRSVLVTFQYCVTFGIIFSLGIVYLQLDYVFTADPGFRKEQLLNIRLTPSIRNNLESFKNELSGNSAIKSLSAASRIPTGQLNDAWGARFYKSDTASNVNFRFPGIVVDKAFVETYDLQLIDGQDFEEYMDNDSIGYFIINETAVTKLGFNSPGEVLGKKMIYGRLEGQIYGVVKDFHFESVHAEIQPLLLLKADFNLRNLTILTDGQNTREVLEFIEAKWAEFEPNSAISYRFVDELFENQYQKERRLSQLFESFAGIALFIACLGMLGMISFTLERKTKEIGIRKVLGASSPDLLWLVSRHFFVLMVFAYLIAIPICQWLMSGWLDNFAYSTGLHWTVYVLPAFVVIGLTILSISYRAGKAVAMNPVYSLRDE